MNDRTIEHEADVRAVIRSELTLPNEDPLVLLTFGTSNVGNSYSKAELDGYFDAYSQTINFLIERLGAAGLLTVYE